MLWGTENMCLKVHDLKKIFFDLFWPVFDLFTYNLTLFLPCQKNRGGSVRKKKNFAKIWFVTCKTWYKSQKIHPLWVKNPAEIQETSFGQGRNFFFKIFLPYMRQLEFISVKLWVLGIISWCSAQIRRDGKSGWAGWAFAHPAFGRIEGASGKWRHYYFWPILNN